MPLIYNQKHTVTKMKFIDLKMIRMLSAPEIYSEAEEILRINKSNIIKAGNEKVEALWNIEEGKFRLIIAKK